MKDNNYYVVHGWMINKLNLKRNNLLVFALIFGFSQDQETYFSGSLKYIMKAIGASKNTVLKSVNELIDLGLIVKKEEWSNNIKFCYYAQNEQVVQKLVYSGSELGSTGGSVSEPNITNINNTISNNKEEPKKKSAQNPQETEQDLFGEKTNPNKKTLFRNSAYFELSIFKNKLKEVEALGVDLEYYHRSIDNWSESKSQKRTARGWIATAKTWMEKDKDNKRLRMVNQDDSQTITDEMHEYLNT